jgi:hypothetical protein
MWIEKLVYGVLRVWTPLGPRYLKPSFWQRFYLLWIFRHFPTLPIKVLSSRQQRFLEALWIQERFVSFGLGVDDASLIGTLEQRPAVPQDTSVRKPARSINDSVAALTADANQQ